MDVKPLDKITYENFAGAVKTRFRVWIDVQNSLELELLEASRPRMISAGGANNTHENFTLLFHGPVDPKLLERIYHFESAVLGRFELFIVPVGLDSQSTKYQATFNRQLKAP